MTDQVCVRLPPHFKAAVEAEADRLGYMDVSEYTRDALREKVGGGELTKQHQNGGVAANEQP